MLRVIIAKKLQFARTNYFVTKCRNNITRHLVTMDKFSEKFRGKYLAVKKKLMQLQQVTAVKK